MSNSHWRTEIPNSPAKFSIAHEDKILLLGSCFAENIGTKLRINGFPATINPTGILYNPMAIYNMLSIINNPSTLDENRYVERQGHFFHYDFHSDFHAKTQQEFHSKLLDVADEIPDKPAIIIITLGTAWVYEYQYKVTGNCHKQAADLFEKRMLSINEITATLQQIRQLIDPATRMILTVSPVRHTRDGIVENQRSKSHLISAVHRFLERNEEDMYFPSYEIMMDDLRDYRFYKEDLLHPNSQAIDYIWGIFSAWFFQEKTKAINKDILSIYNMEQHRPFFPESQEHTKFLETLKARKMKLLSEYPFLDL